MIKHWGSLRYSDPTMLFRPVGQRVGPNGFEDGPLEFFIGDKNDANTFKKIKHPDQIFLKGNGITLFSMEDWRFAEPLLRLCKEYYDAIPGNKANQIHQCAELLNEFPLDKSQTTNLVTNTIKSPYHNLTYNQKSSFFSAVLHRLQELQDRQQN